MNGRGGQVDGIDRRRFLRVAGSGAAALAIGPGRGAARRAFSAEDHVVTSSDGTELAVTLYVPDADGPNPAILITHGWGGSRNLSPRLLAETYVNHGYVVAAYDSRGFGDSGGVSALNGSKEVADARRLIDWLAARPEVETVDNGNPRLGMDGLSYGGGIQYLVAAADDRVDAIVPRITWNDLSYSLVPNGAIKGTWLTGLLGLGTVGTFDLPEGVRLSDDLTDWYAEALATNEFPEEAATAFENRSIASILDSPFERFTTPTFVIHGLDDSLFPPTEAIRTYRVLQQRDVESRLLLYGGGHTLDELTVPTNSRDYMTEQTLAWMDRHLGGEDVDVPQASTVLEQRGEIRTDEQFPPADTLTELLAFDAASRDGDNTIEQWSLFGDSSVTYTWEGRTAVEIVGTPELELSVDVHGPEARLFVRFLHDGEPINGVREAYRFEGGGHHEVQFPYPTLQRFVTADETVGLAVSVTDPLHFDSRRSDGVTIHDEESVVRLPTRPM